MRSANIRIRHGGCVVLERVADVAVLIAAGAIGVVVQFVFVGEILIPLVAVKLPRNIVFVQIVAETGRRRGRNVNAVLFGLLSVYALLPSPK